MSLRNRQTINQKQLLARRILKGSALGILLFACFYIWGNFGFKKEALAAPPSNDAKASAIVISSVSGYSSSNAEFTTVGATADQAKGSCWNTGPNYNVWFQFQATTQNIVIQVKSGGVYGTLQYPYLALWDSVGNQLGCATYATATGVLEYSSVSITPGATYYLSVDNYGSTGYRGTFSLSIDDQPGYDFFEGAQIIPSTSNWNSSNAAFTTLSATPDRSKGSCWNTGPNYNRWFKFVASTPSITLQVKTGGSYGTLQYPYIALWDSALNALGCMQYSTATGTLELSSVGLNPGGTYYFSVDNYGSSGYRGTFSLSVNDQPSYDFKEGALVIPSVSNWSSANAAYTTIDATADRAKGSCANTGPNYNRWFSFTASTSFIDVQVKTGGVYGTLQYPYVAIWDSALNQIGCMQYSTATGTLEISANNLTPGGNYYITVDNYGSNGYRGTFSLSIDDQPTYDFVEGAVVIPSMSNWSSSNAAYSTVNATADHFKGSCWNTGPNYNRWFTFTASTEFATIQVLSGGAYGTLQYPYIALWDSALNQIGCIQYTTSTGTLELSVNGLSVGGTYYISVDNYGSAGYRGTFSLYVDDQPNYNFMEGAIALPSTSNWRSANAAYSTINATADRTKGNCWNTGPNYNRWFSFTASTQFATVQVISGGVNGTMQYPYIAIWDSALNQVGCMQYSSATGTLELSVNGLAVGSKYYISVDNYGNSGYRGTFSLYIDDQPNYNFVEGAIELTSLSNWSSANATYSTINASADRSKGSCWNTGPTYNRWFKFVATTSAITFQVKSGGAYGTLQYPYSALWDSSLNQLGCAMYVTSTGTLELSQTGLTPGATYYFSVDNYASAGYRGTFSLYANDQPTFDFQAGAVVLSSISNWCSSNAAYTTSNATADGTRPSCFVNGPNNNVWFKFNASTNAITVLVKTGGAYGTMQYPYVSIWDTLNNVVSCMRYATSTGTVELSYYGLTIGNNYYISVDNFSGYKGSFSICVDDQPTYNYKEGAIELTQFSNWTSPMAAYSTVYANADRSKGSCWTNGPNNNRWFKFLAVTPNMQIDVISGGAYGTLQYPFLTLYTSAIAQMGCAKYVSATGTLGMTVSGLVPGNWYYMAVDNYVGYAGSFTLHMNGFSPLPVKMEDFFAEAKDQKVDLNWITASEINNDHFQIQRSRDGIDFENIGVVRGYGNSTQRKEYSFTDESPITGLSFYKLIQVDYNGTAEEYGPVSVHIDPDKKDLKIESASPNPFEDHLTIALSSPVSGSMSIEIYSSSGTLMHSEKIEVLEGTASIEIGTLDELPSGIYMLTAIGEGIRCTPVRIMKN